MVTRNQRRAIRNLNPDFLYRSQTKEFFHSAEQTLDFVSRKRRRRTRFQLKQQAKSQPYKRSATSPSFQSTQTTQSSKSDKCSTPCESSTPSQPSTPHQVSTPSQLSDHLSTSSQTQSTSFSDSSYFYLLTRYPPLNHQQCVGDDCFLKPQIDSCYPFKIPEHLIPFMNIN